MECQMKITTAHDKRMPQERTECKDGNIWLMTDSKCQMKMTEENDRGT